MNTDQGVPEPQVVIYAIPRGSYDDHLWELEQAIKARREAVARVGNLIMARGDYLELMDDLPKARAIESAIVQVVRVPKERNKITVRIHRTMLPTHMLGKVVKIPRHWVLCPAAGE